MPIVTIYNNGKSADIDRYDKPHNFKGNKSRRYLQPSAASMARLYRIIQNLKAYHTDTPPHWTSYTLIKDPTERNHYAMLNQDHKQIGQRWEINAKIYQTFLEILPPLGLRHDRFYMREFVRGRMTTKYSRQGNRYFCEFVLWQGQDRIPDEITDEMLEETSQ